MLNLGQLVLGRYKLKHPIRTTKTATFFVAEDLLLERAVMVKVFATGTVRAATNILGEA